VRPPTVLIVAILGLAGCAREAAPPPQAPRLVVDETRFDAGTVEQGAAIRHRFTIRNGGGSPLHIGGVRASCNCSAAVVGDAAIPARQSGAIDVTLHTDDLAGRSTRSFTVFSNDPAQPALRLEVAADVAPHAVVEPRQLYLGEIARGGRSERPVQVSFPRAPRARAVAIKPRGVIVEPRWLGPEAPLRRFDVGIDANAPTGPFSEIVAVRTTHPQRPVVDIVVAGIVVEAGKGAAGE
jgi:hypothetical protein